MIFGDFNYPNITWNEDGSGKTIIETKPAEDKFVDLLDNLFLSHKVTKPTF